MKNWILYSFKVSSCETAINYKRRVINLQWRNLTDPVTTKRGNGVLCEGHSISSVTSPANHLTSSWRYGTNPNEGALLKLQKYKDQRDRERTRIYARLKDAKETSPGILDWILTIVYFSFDIKYFSS